MIIDKDIQTLKSTEWKYLKRDGTFKVLNAYTAEDDDFITWIEQQISTEGKKNITMHNRLRYRLEWLKVIDKVRSYKEEEQI
jgi:hypothetical protein